MRTKANHLIPGHANGMGVSIWRDTSCECLWLCAPGPLPLMAMRIRKFGRQSRWPCWLNLSDSCWIAELRAVKRAIDLVGACERLACKLASEASYPAIRLSSYPVCCQPAGLADEREMISNICAANNISLWQSSYLGGSFYRSSELLYLFMNRSSKSSWRRHFTKPASRRPPD